MHRPRLVVVGSSNTDMVVHTDRLPRPGETVGGGQFLLAAGGKGANQAVAAARLGADVTFVARVGADLFGDQAVRQYQAEGLRTEFVVRDPDQPTGVALILVDGQGQNSIAVAPGANAALAPADVDRAADAIRQADLVVLQLEVPLDVVRHAARLAAGAGVRVVLNPAPAVPLPTDLLRDVAYLTPNETEAGILTGAVVHDDAGAREAAAELRRQGAAAVVVTLGARGALLATAAGVELVPPTPVTAVDTTAAGDAFNAGFACALAQGASPAEAVRRGCRVGALSTTRRGAQPSLPTARELEAFEASLER